MPKQPKHLEELFHEGLNDIYFAEKKLLVSQEIIEDYDGSPALDAGLIGAAQAAEHYEIARHGTLKAWATELGPQEAVRLLNTTLAEENKTDKILTELAEASANARAQAA